MGIFRIALAACVLFGHGAPLGHLNWVPSTTAVEMFFVISGFYMQMILAERYTPERLGSRYAARFYLARYSRLFPAYLLCLILVLLASVVYSVLIGKDAPLVAQWKALFALPLNANNLALWIWLLVCNATMSLQDLMLVLAVNDATAHFTIDRMTTEYYVATALAIPQAWSLSVELVFYAVAPFLLRQRNGVLIGVFLVALVAKVGAMLASGLGDLPYRLTPFVFVDFLAGALVYRYRSFLTSGSVLEGRFGLWTAYAIVAILVAAVPQTDPRVAIVMVALTALVTPTVFAATRRVRGDNEIGELSYPFYIFHLLIYDSCVLLFRMAHVSEVNNPLVTLVALIGTLVVSYGVFRLEQRFIEPWRRRLSDPVTFEGRAVIA